MARLTPFRFNPRPSPAASFAPLPKFAALALLSAAASAAPAFAVIPFVALGMAAVAAAGAFSPGEGGIVGGALALARRGTFVAVMTAFVAAVSLVGAGEDALAATIADSLVYGARLIAIFLLAEAFFVSTSPSALADSLTGAARLVSRRPDADPGLAVGLATGFIPACAERHAKTREAALARGHGLPKNPLWHAKSSLLVLESFSASCLRHAARSADALEARGYSASRSAFPPPSRARDFLLVAFSLAVLAFSLFPKS